MFGWFGQSRDKAAARALYESALEAARAPALFSAYGTPDTLVPVEQARPFAEAMAKTSEHAVVYAELAGANHAFDIFPSPRSVRTTEYVERFLSGVHLGLIK